MWIGRCGWCDTVKVFDGDKPSEGPLSVRYRCRIVIDTSGPFEQPDPTPCSGEYEPISLKDSL